MTHVPFCAWCGLKEVQIVLNDVGDGYCSLDCKETDEMRAEWESDGAADLNNMMEKDMPEDFDSPDDFVPEEDEYEFEDEYPGETTEEGYEDNFTDAEADADVLKSCGWGTDEDYGYYGEDE